MSQPPEFYEQGKRDFPDVFESYEALSRATKAAGPLDARSVALVKLAPSIASGLAGATHANTRKALTTGCTPEELRQVVLLAVTTIGFPAMMRGRAWVEDVLSAE